MILRNKNILLISPEPWDHIFVSKHHYAIHLGQRGNRVFFLNPPGKIRSTRPTPHENVVSVHYEGFPKGLRFYPSVLQRYFIRKKFHELETLCASRFDIVWSFDNSVFFNFSALPASVLTISHIVDLTQDFQQEKAAATATLCLGSTHFIVERLRKSNPRSFFVQHGYAQRNDTEYIEIPGRYAIRAGYAGNLGLRYIDWNLLDNLTSVHHEVGFYFAGPYSQDHEIIRRVRSKPNTFFLGEIPSAQLSSFYGQMDVLLLCYFADDHSDQLANPHKMMEYLGSGKVIVATMTKEHEHLSSGKLIVMSERNQQYAQLFGQTVQDLDFWNNPERQRLRCDYALKNTYNKQTNRIESILCEETGRHQYPEL